jgi:2-aminoethylphosphonate-pyruvate transaminase
LRAALNQFHAQGGQPARLRRYVENYTALVSGMRALGFQTFLPDSIHAPIIVTFNAPADPRYNFGEFYRRVRDRGFILYPGKLTTVDTFRVGCIGAIGPDTLRQAVSAIGAAIRAMGIRIA